MAKHILYFAVAAVLVLLINVTLVKTKTVYFLQGGSLILTPEPQTKPITSITWRNKGNIVTEWIKDLIELQDFGDFKGRTKLNLDTGKLTITTARPSDEGEFLVEINNVVQSVRYNAKMLQKVPKPVVILRPLTCQQSSEHCSLSCEGDVSPVHGPLTYSWKEGDGEWKQSEKDMNITNNGTTQGVQTYSCKIENPLSKEESNAFVNVFYKPPVPAGNTTGIISGVLLLIVLAVVGCLAYYYRENLLTKLRARKEPTGKNDVDSTQSQALQESNPDAEK